MESLNNTRLFRITNLKSKNRLSQTMKGVSMHIQAPILKEYKSIDLSKNNNTKRIRHKTTYEPSNNEEIQMQTLISGKKWESVIGDYIQAKRNIIIKKGQLNRFQFLQLNKTNKNLYKRLVKRQSLPQTYMKKTLNQQYIIHKQESYTNKSKQQIKIKEKIKESIENNKSVNESQIFYETMQNNPSQRQYEDKVLNNFLSNYFKKKYKRQMSRKISNKSHKIQYKILTKSKGKLHHHHIIKDQLYRTNTD